MISVFDRVENIVGKGENGNQHFLHFPLCFQKAPTEVSANVGMCGEKLKSRKPFGKWRKCW